MPPPREDVDATTPNLADKYAIVGVGETDYTRGSNRTTRALANNRSAQRHPRCGTQSVRDRRHAVVSVQRLDVSPFVAGDLGIRLNFYMDVFGGGSSTKALIGIAIGVIEAGMCKTVVIFRSMNGFSQVRIGGTGVRAAAPVSGDAPQPRLRLAERGSRSRRPSCATCTISDHRRAGRPCPRRPQPSRFEQSQSLLKSASRCRMSSAAA